MAAGGHFGCPKITFNLIFIHFTIFDEMADVGHFGCPKFTFDRISDHFRSICNLIFFWQNGCRRPSWMSEIHFLLHFWPFQINWPFWISEIHFRSQFWPFQIDTEFFFGGHFGCPKFTFDGISSHFRSIRNFIIFIFDKMAAGGHFRCPQITYDHISGHFRSIRNFFFTKWPPAAILNGTTMSIIELVRDIWMSNACVKFEERSLNPSKVIALTKLWRLRPY